MFVLKVHVTTEDEIFDDRQVVIEFRHNWLQQEVKYYCLRTRNSFTSVWNKEELPHQWKESIIVPIYKNCKKTD
jgi:hypothetical protein